jgi:hypothetical protein
MRQCSVGVHLIRGYKVHRLEATRSRLEAGSSFAQVELLLGPLSLTDSFCWVECEIRGLGFALLLPPAPRTPCASSGAW